MENQNDNITNDLSQSANSVRDISSSANDVIRQMNKNSKPNVSVNAPGGQGNVNPAQKPHMESEPKPQSAKKEDAGDGSGTVASKKKPNSAKKKKNAQKAKKAEDDVKKGADAAKAVAEKSAEAAKRAATDAATAGAAEAVNTPEAITKRIQQSAKEREKVKKENAKDSKDAESKKQMKAVVIIVFLIIASMLFQRIFIQLNPLLSDLTVATTYVTGGTADDDGNTSDTVTDDNVLSKAYETAMEKYHGTDNRILNLIKKTKIYQYAHKLLPKSVERAMSLFDDAEDDDILLFNGSKTVAETYNAFQESMEGYFEEALELKRSEIAADIQKSDIDVTIDIEMTEEKFDDQGDPFAAVDYAAVIAAYATADSDITESSLKKFEDTMKEHEEDFLHVGYYASNVEEQDDIVPEEVYKYDEENVTLDVSDYLQYLSLFEDGAPELQAAAIESLNNQAMEQWNTYLSESTAAKNCAKAAAAVAASAGDDEAAAAGANAMAAFYAAEAMKHQKNADTAMNNYKVLEQKIRKIETGEIFVTYDTAEENSEKITQDVCSLSGDLNPTHVVTEYHIVYDEDNDKVIDHYNQTREGEFLDDYTDATVAGFAENTFFITGQSQHEPTLENGRLIQKYYVTPVIEPFDNDDLFAIFGLDPDATYALAEKWDKTYTNKMMYNHYYDMICKQMDGVVSTAVKSSGHVCSLTTEEIKEYLENAANFTGTTASLRANVDHTVSGNRLQLLKTALELTGAVYYSFGEKASSPGWNDDWWTAEGINSYKGLDCSGFVQWADWTTFGTRQGKLEGTYYITQSCKEIQYKDLKPGDIGTKFIGGSDEGTKVYNHVGIYLGKDEDGNDLWIHCTGGNIKTVTINNYSGFHYFFSINDRIDESDCWTGYDDIAPYGDSALMGSDATYLLCGLLRAESNTDDGSIACLEAMMNKIESKGEPVNLESLMALATKPNYLETYTKYLNDEKGNTITSQFIKSPNSNMIAAVVSKINKQDRTYIKSLNVGNWRGRDVYMDYSGSTVNEKAKNCCRKNGWHFYSIVGGNMFFSY